MKGGRGKEEGTVDLWLGWRYQLTVPTRNLKPTVFRFPPVVGY